MTVTLRPSSNRTGGFPASGSPRVIHRIASTFRCPGRMIRHLKQTEFPSDNHPNESNSSQALFSKIALLNDDAIEPHPQSRTLRIEYVSAPGELLGLEIDPIDQVRGDLDGGSPSFGDRQSKLKARRRVKPHVGD